ncbi:hypothetical protein BCR34DRAFT_605268 [Clohesyomyces aquaticus]|uniref:Uncharacterized protein n=1 Tax=Clohesyomyces aquaticus TaxID=1231657 RepID=A0A1Y1YZ36_9PLEO|nr:hypothetical protein BCR34DRAFT_605268 [Clohesyomyces aquaticus]
MMIDEQSADGAGHYYAVFNRGTRWHAKFFAINQANPVGDQYLGQKDDLDELCAFLVDEALPRIGPGSVLHVLVPSGKPIAFADLMKFPEKLRPDLGKFDVDAGILMARLIYEGPEPPRTLGQPYWFATLSQSRFNITSNALSSIPLTSSLSTLSRDTLTHHRSQIYFAYKDFNYELPPRTIDNNNLIPGWQADADA